MNPSSDQIEAAFNEAVEQPTPAAREAFLQHHCRHDDELFHRVEALLAAYDAADEFLERAPAAELPCGTIRNDASSATFGSSKSEKAGERVGRYKLLQQIGEGGFGTVWMAEQQEPVRRHVALKIIKIGMDTKEVVARFEQERQALALMEHPSIAKVFDAGATPLGRSFFVMELVKGVKITDYCDQANLSTVERLKLFIQVCQAVQHAHQKGIIHRDLKPGNILVTHYDGVAVPKVIDFGVAKATQQQRLTDLTLFTQFEQMVGTPLYMSPEQAELSGLDIDTRSDIYSLGVLLYELLAGRTPFDPETLLKAGYDEMRRVIREVEPQKPSTFLSTMAIDLRTNVARHRGAEGARLISALRGDLDWIVMKALEKDRNRRYETATGVAKDIERHLGNEPVLARPPTGGYRFRRLVRRNKPVVAAAGAVAVALLLGIAGIVWQMLRVEQEAARANAALADLRASAPAFVAQARALVAKEQFDEALEKLEYALKLRPDCQEYLGAKADLLQSQLRLKEAGAVYRQVVKLVPGDRRALLNAALCDRLANAAPGDPQAKLPRQDLAELLSHMTHEQRSAAELMAVARALGKEKIILLNYWLERLADLPIPLEPPLKERLTVREDGLLALDLSNTEIRDLRPFFGMPLGYLDCTNCQDLEDAQAVSGMPLTVLYLGNTKVSELAPLKSLLSLEMLTIQGTKVTDLSPLRGLPLTVLSASNTAVSDLSPLLGMALEHLRIEATQVSDLSPLLGMPLRLLYAGSIPSEDFSALKNMPLDELILQHTKVGDLAFLQGMQLKELYINGCPNARNFQVLSDIETLEVLTLPQTYRNLPERERSAIGALREHPKLRQIEAAPVPGLRVDVAQSKGAFWQQWDRQAALLDPLQKAGVEIGFTILPDGTWDISLQNQPVNDISCLRGAPISRLVLMNTSISDLAPLAGMPLKVLGVQKTQVTNLRPVKGLPLTDLFLDGCPPGMDLKALSEVPTLERIMLPADPQNLETLRSLPNLKYISFSYDYQAARPSMAAAEFWKWRQNTVAEIMARKGKFAEVEQLARKRLASGAKAFEKVDLLTWAVAALAAGDRASYRAACAEMVERFKESKMPTEAEAAAKACLLAPDSGATEADLTVLIETARPMENDTGIRSRFFLTSGLREYRAGNWIRARELLHNVGTEWAAVQPAAAAVLAMDYHKQNIPAEAKRFLGIAQSRIELQWPGLPGNAGAWQDWLIAHLLLREAESLLTPPSVEDTLVLEGKFAELALHLRKRLAEASSGTDTSMDWLRLGLTVLEQGDLDGYRAVCKGMLEQFRTTATPPQAERVVKLCLASTDSGIGVIEVAAFLNVQQTGPNPVGDAYFKFSHGLVAYRAGELDKAVDLLRAVNLRPFMTAPAAAVLALTYHKQGNSAAAIQALASAREQTGPQWPGPRSRHDWLLATLLLREAETLVGVRALPQEKK